MTAASPEGSDRPEPNPQRMRLFRRILAGLVLLIVVLGLLGAEWAVRQRERTRTHPPDYFPSIYYPHRRLAYALVPNSDYFGWLKINSLGFRGPEVSVGKRPGVLRVLCLGGSTTFDIGSVGNSPPWPEVLESELRELVHGSEVEVFNLGIGGATSLDSLIDLQIRALALQPDLVVVYQGQNDFAYSIPSSLPRSSNLYPMEDKPRSALKRWFSYNSLLYAKTTGQLAARFGRLFGGKPAAKRDHAATMAAVEQGLAGFRSNMTSLAAIARANELPLALVEVVLPFPEDAQGACSMCDALSPTFGGIAPPDVRVMFERYDAVLAGLAAADPAVHHIATDGAVPAADGFWSDPIHFGPEGSLRMGHHVAEALAPILRDLATGGAESVEAELRP